MSSKIRWGVLGCGGIARRRTIPEGILPARNAELVAVYNPTATTNLEVARLFGACPVPSVSQLLAADVDAVYIASPPGFHREQTEACARAGKHVLCEKPLALTVDDAVAMVDTCARAGVWLGTAFMMRLHAQHRAALHLLREGQLGQPVFARAQLSCWYPPLPGAWRQHPSTGGGGALMDMGGHCLDLLEMFFGPLAGVSCLTHRTVHEYPSEDSAIVSLRFANGALGVVDTSFCLPDYASENRLELYGTRGSILARHTLGQGHGGDMTAHLLAPNPGYDPQQSRSPTSPSTLAPPRVNTYQAEIEEFSQAILEARPPALTGALGLRSQRVLAACYESARTGQWQPLDGVPAAEPH